MSDQQLLGLAAKAAGYVVRWYDDSLAYGPTFGIEVESGNPSGFEPWNPLEDDGDAFRLAFALGIRIHWFGVIAEVRRAIVRAAAEIGKAMQEKH